MGCHIRLLVVILLTCLSRSGVDLTKTPSNGTCLGEWVFVMLVVIHCCFCDVVFHSLLFDVIPHLSVSYRQVFTPILYFQPSPSQSDLRHFHFNLFLTFSVTVLLQRLRFWVGFFLPTGVFYLTLLPDIFDTTSLHQGLPGSRQFFLKVFRASCWSSKHRLDPSVCLSHNNPQKGDGGRFYLWFTAGWLREVF